MSPACRLRCCGASGCRSAGSEALRGALERARDQLDGAAGAVAIKPVGCLRLCGRGPLVAVDRRDNEGRWRQRGLYGGLRQEDAAPLLQRAAELVAVDRANSVLTGEAGLVQTGGN